MDNYVPDAIIVHTLPSIKFERGIELGEMELREIIEQPAREPPCSSDVRRRKIIHTAIIRSIKDVPCFSQWEIEIIHGGISRVPRSECSLVVYLKFSSRSKIYHPTSPSRPLPNRGRPSDRPDPPRQPICTLKIKFAFHGNLIIRYRGLLRVTTRADPC